MKNDKPLHIKIPDRLYDALQVTAERKCISMASLVRMLCSEGLERDGIIIAEGVTAEQGMPAKGGVRSE